MTKIEQIEDAIEKALRRESKLTPLAISVPMLGSLQIRHLLNNLGAVSKRFLDVGCHRGGSYCSAMFKNDDIEHATAVDSWASDIIEGMECEKDFRENAELLTPSQSKLVVLKGDCFDVSIGEVHGVDFFSYDAGHSKEDQKEALVYYRPALANEFIYVCDDWTFGDVKEGTMQGIEEGGYEILYQRELLNDTPGDGHLNEEWWRGYAVFLLKKKP